MDFILRFFLVKSGQGNFWSFLFELMRKLLVFLFQVVLILFEVFLEESRQENLFYPSFMTKE